MKKLKYLFLMYFISSSMFGQQAIWGGEEIISPLINKDNSVTFTLDAPNAEKVQITGDFLPKEKVKTPFGEADVPIVVDMGRNENGVWNYISKVLPSELYSYSFIVDGVKVTDPSNVYSVRDVNSTTSIFLIDGGIADLYKVNNVPHGTVTKQWYNSPTLNKERRMTVYTPVGYEDNNQQYPVLYLLHGMGGDEEAWNDLGRAIEILDNLIAQGKAEPMIVVMPNGNVFQSAAPGKSSDGLKKPIFKLPNTMDGKMESSFPDIVNFVDSHYRTIKEKKARAIAGLSMGGFHSLHISKEYPDMFDYVGLFSAAVTPDVIPEGDVNSPIYQDMKEKLKIQIDKKPKLYWIAIGKTDFLYPYNVDFRKMLDNVNADYTYYESEDGHIWKNWRIYLSMFLPQLFK